MLRHPIAATTESPEAQVLPFSDTLVPPLPAHMPPSPDTRPIHFPAGPGRHRDLQTEPDWLRQWGISLVSGVVILVTILVVATVLLVTHDDESSTGPGVQTATGAGPQAVDPTPEPTTSPTAPTPGPTRATSTAPMDRLAAFAADVQQQINAGNLDPEPGRDLLQDLSEAARRLHKGHHHKAAEVLARLDERLAELREDGKLTPAGFAALDHVDSIIDSLGDAGRDQD